MKSLLAILPFIRQKTGLYLKKIKKHWVFPKDPLIYFGVFSVIFLLGVAIVGPARSSLLKTEYSLLSADTRNKIFSQNLFAEPVKNIYGEFPQMVFLQQNSLLGVVSPSMVSSQSLGSLIGEDELADPENQESIIEYIVQPGDNLSSIAGKFNISTNTILWANNLSAKSVIKSGQKLIILPVSGVLHNVKAGDTLGAIALIYKAKTEDIVVFNNLTGEGDIFIEDILVIPNGQMPISPKPVNFAQTQIPIGSSYFICPTLACKITQNLHWYNAVDFGGQCGDPIYAAAAGTVQKVLFGWNGGLGNYLSILHPNGVVTIYGHLSASLVVANQEVSQGQIVALMGGKPGTAGAGISTGCHVHFDVRGGRNPFGN